MSPALLTSLLAGFLVGMVLALLMVRLLVPRHARERQQADAEAWAAVVSQALRELKSREAEAESQRARAELLYRMILDTVPTGVVTFDAAGVAITANPVARRLLDVDPPARLDLPSPLADHLRSALEGVSPPYMEVDLSSGGQKVPVGVQTRPLVAGGSTAGAVMVLVELVELRRLQVRARLMEELADLGQLAAGIAHEFRNATGAMRASAEFLARHVTGPVREAVDDLLTETERLSRVTTDLLDFARPWERGVEQVELDAVAREVVGRLSGLFPSHQIDLSLSCPGKTVMGKAALLARVVDNLVRNALEASPEAQAVRVVTDESGDETGRWLVLSVMDRGPGLPPGDHEDLFKPFRSGKPSGTGIGLALARKITLLHGGTLTLVNREGGGAVATLRLPLSEPQEAR